MKILVTGGAGFIGSHVVDRLIQEGHQVAVLDNLSTGKRKNVHRNARFYKMDIQRPAIHRVFRSERPTVIVHLAAQIDVRRSTADPAYDAGVNILGTLNVLARAVEYGARKVLFASSGGAIYGEQQMFPAPETHPTEPLSPYGISKLAGEKYLAYYTHEVGIETVSLRLGNVYGPRQATDGEAGVVAIFTEKMLKGEQPVINGTGKQTRDFVYVDDVVDAFLMMVDPGVQGIFNVGTGCETSINECFQQLKRLTGSSCKELHGPAKKGEQLRSVLDIAKIREQFGWEPQISFPEGLQRTVEFFRSSQ